jgi:hypothetical protein
MRKGIVAVLFVVIVAHGAGFFAAVPAQAAQVDAALCGGEVVRTGPIDILFAFDTTGSMSGVLNTAQRQANEIMGSLRSTFAGGDIHFGVAEFKDYEDGLPYKLHRSLVGSPGNGSVTSAINSLYTAGGGDGPESYARVLYESYADGSIGWRQDSVHIVMMFGDNGPHDQQGLITSDSAYRAPGYYDPVAGIATYNSFARNASVADIVSTMKERDKRLIMLSSGNDSYWRVAAAATSGAQLTIGANPADLVNAMVVTLTDVLPPDPSTDQDGDGVLTAQCAPWCPVGKTCTDTYDDPADFGLNAQDIAIPETGQTWADLFGTTANDLDGDGELVAQGRQPFGFPTPPTGGRDWYDNPFTTDFDVLSVQPTTTQLSHTINDIDLDGFIIQSWANLFAPTSVLVEPDIADIAASHGVNIGGCVFPGAFEGKCEDCTAHIPDTATGRVPATKTNVSTPNSKDVCQIEAYYEDLDSEVVRYEVITAGQADSSRRVRALSVHCADDVDNNLNGIPEGLEPSCPKAGGLVPCGRDADNFLTFRDETEQCTVCHGFALGHNVVTFLLVPSSFNNGFAAVMLLAILMFAVAGMFMIAGGVGGNSGVFGKAKTMLFAVIIGIAIIYGAWVFVELILTIFGAVDFTGTGTWWQIAC